MPVNRAMLVCLVGFLTGAAIALPGCSPLEAQSEACFARVDERTKAAIKARCQNYTWDSCPEKDSIRAERKARQDKCP